MEENLAMGSNAAVYLFSDKEEMEAKVVRGEVSWAKGVQVYICNEGLGVFSTTCCRSTHINNRNMLGQRYNLK